MSSSSAAPVDPNDLLKVMPSDIDHLAWIAKANAAFEEMPEYIGNVDEDAVRSTVYFPASDREGYPIFTIVNPVMGVTDTEREKDLISHSPYGGLHLQLPAGVGDYTNKWTARGNFVTEEQLQQIIDRFKNPKLKNMYELKDVVKASLSIQYSSRAYDDCVRTSSDQSLAVIGALRKLAKWTEERHKFVAANMHLFPSFFTDDEGVAARMDENPAAYPYDAKLEEELLELRVDVDKPSRPHLKPYEHLTQEGIEEVLGKGPGDGSDYDDVKKYMTDVRAYEDDLAKLKAQHKEDLIEGKRVTYPASCIYSYIRAKSAPGYRLRKRKDKETGKLSTVDQSHHLEIKGKLYSHPKWSPLDADEQKKLMDVVAELGQGVRDPEGRLPTDPLLREPILDRPVMDKQKSDNAAVKFLMPGLLDVNTGQFVHPDDVKIHPGAVIAPNVNWVMRNVASKASTAVSGYTTARFIALIKQGKPYGHSDEASERDASVKKMRLGVFQKKRPAMPATTREAPSLDDANGTVAPVQPPAKKPRLASSEGEADDDEEEEGAGEALDADME